MKSFADYTEEEHREISQRGGIASGEARQKRKKLREELIEILSDGDIQKRVCVALVDRALKTGDYKVFRTIRDTVGEKPPAQVHIDEIGLYDESIRAEALNEARNALGLDRKNVEEDEQDEPEDE